MRNKYFFAIWYMMCILMVSVSAQVPFCIQICNVRPDGGIVYVAVYTDKESYKKEKPAYTFKTEPTSEIISVQTELPVGEYSVSVFQDMNENAKLDTGIFGIPKEPAGVSNWNGKGTPGSWDKQKININESHGSVQINLYQL